MADFDELAAVCSGAAGLPIGTHADTCPHAHTRLPDRDCIAGDRSYRYGFADAPHLDRCPNIHTIRCRANYDHSADVHRNGYGGPFSAYSHPVRAR